MKSPRLARPSWRRRSLGRKGGRERRAIGEPRILLIGACIWPVSPEFSGSLMGWWLQNTQWADNMQPCGWWYEGVWDLESAMQGEGGSLVKYIKSSSIYIRDTVCITSYSRDWIWFLDLQRTWSNKESMTSTLRIGIISSWESVIQGISILISANCQPFLRGFASTT